jgi:hypothetical protein
MVTELGYQMLNSVPYFDDLYQGSKRLTHPRLEGIANISNASEA